MMPVFGCPKTLMTTEKDSDLPGKCHDRRRRRIETRRRLASAYGGDNRDLKGDNSEAETSLVRPVYGSMSVVGRAREMEDEISVKIDLCRPEINGFRPVHFFGVFDGHGGHHVSTLCKENMHVIMEEELMRMKLTTERLTDGELEVAWRTAINRTFERMDEKALTLCQCDGLENFKVCRYHPQLSLVGSTAVVVLLTQEFIIVGNCGDSRAVLCRNGKAVPLSFDHKPDREDERKRIKALGGQILFSGSGARVGGVLAMTRAIGDRFLKQVVTSEPEYMFMKREADDMSLILASDGLWDVLSNEVTCEVAEIAVRGGGALYTAAALLVRLAMGRRSTDNVSVIVVDLRG
ncbi:hypothetical protein M8C21_002376 [Ambrosia artemisiifolia]|uniref:protein-serine/threonine phosphatase n=1 Tax=Ambrosia artemisiifolia TaxID=4212 RepID=A0AAD5C6P1_AMBAR|nr:hypothetical protein M8C21_002376 [Ambrosia artemisiifolia]